MEWGIGVRNFAEVQKDLHMKFVWHLLSLDNLWTRFFKEKYLKGKLFLETNGKNPDSMF